MNKHGKLDKAAQLNIKDAEVRQLAQELSALTGESLTGAIKTALKEKLERQQHELTKGDRAERLKHLADEFAATVKRPTISAEEAIGYDEHGLPS